MYSEPPQIILYLRNKVYFFFFVKPESKSPRE